MPSPLRLLTVIGARPQIIKAAAISHAVAGTYKGRIRETLLHTGQHYDANMSQVFFDELGIPRADVHLGVGSGAPGERTAHMIQGIEAELQRGGYDAVLLYGDTDSTLAGAIAASKLRVPVAHVEAGLRSYDKTMPEELNRVMTDHCSTWLFCPTDTALHNLAQEGFRVRGDLKPTANEPHLSNSGDVMFDNSMRFAALARQRSTLLAQLGLHADGYILATVHRDNNTDDPERLHAILASLLRLHKDHGLPIVLPLHPRTRKAMEVAAVRDLAHELERSKGIRLLPPAGFLDMIALESNAKLVVTDSGGVQKEAFFFGKPCVILRPRTEWVELVEQGQAVLADVDPDRIATAAAHFLEQGVPACPPLFGDGHAAEAICAVLSA